MRDHLDAYFYVNANKTYKENLFEEEENKLNTDKLLKFLHFNRGNTKKLPRKQAKLWQNRTVAVLAYKPEYVKSTAEDFINATLSNTLLIPVNVGVAFVSLDDNYYKKKGREEAEKLMKTIDLKVIGVVSSPTHIFVNLESYKGVSLNLRLNKNSGFSTVTGSLSAEDGQDDW